MFQVTSAAWWLVLAVPLVLYYRQVVQVRAGARKAASVARYAALASVPAVAYGLTGVAIGIVHGASPDLAVVARELTAVVAAGVAEVALLSLLFGAASRRLAVEEAGRAVTGRRRPVGGIGSSGLR